MENYFYIIPGTPSYHWSTVNGERVIMRGPQLMFVLSLNYPWYPFLSEALLMRLLSPKVLLIMQPANLNTVIVVYLPKPLDRKPEECITDQISHQEPFHPEPSEQGMYCLQRHLSQL